jgi:hypothetical protein
MSAMPPNAPPSLIAGADAQLREEGVLGRDREHHDEDEVRRVLAGLRPADAVRLARLAQNWVRRAPRRSADDLLNEVFDRMLQGRRRWPVDLPLPDFASGTMRSIVHEWRLEDEDERLAGDVDLDLEEWPDRTPPARECDVPDMLDRMAAFLAKDPPALAVLSHMRAGTRRAEAALAIGIDLKAYDTTRRRMARSLLTAFGPEWINDDE